MSDLEPVVEPEAHTKVQARIRGPRIGESATLESLDFYQPPC